MLANSFSLLRMGLVPFLLWSLHRDGSGLSSLSAALLIAAAATDWLDGVAARRLGQVSRLGRILDPLADKLLVGSLGAGQVGYDRPFPGAGHYRGHLDGLYLCGSCCHPSGNVTGLPGYNAAQVLMRDLDLRSEFGRD